MEVVSGERSTGESTKAMVAGIPAVAAWSGGKRDASQARDHGSGLVGGGVFASSRTFPSTL